MVLTVSVHFLFHSLRSCPNLLCAWFPPRRHDTPTPVQRRQSTPTPHLAAASAQTWTSAFTRTGGHPPSLHEHYASSSSSISRFLMRTALA
ncbi:hypothetical protein DFH08DRAFT_871117 [Mycena albidolilacea]|uniref:Uncharacterized protein n=1 Tax=Mycena albidolilacea TaxID=1033008 RepID=A0AAD7EQ11_9AGAR|nr:hypothetical protein DFH08DRAFT_871117 [Mycena albidolilacea]